jgi:hypothetical protein
MPVAAHAIRLDPWAAQYEGSIQIAEDSEPAAVDLAVERAAWAAIRPAARVAAPRLAFVDGVRRIEHRVLVGEGTRTVFGLLGSFGVGAVCIEPTGGSRTAARGSGAGPPPARGAAARVCHELLGRVLVVGAGLDADPFVAPVAGGNPLRFEPRSEPANDPNVPVLGLQTAMRQTEAGLAERLAAEVDVVFLDGPLTFLTPAAAGSVVGFVKRQLRNYLEAPAHALLPRLETGERTPVFLITGKEPRYSWYVRIASGRPIESALTGVVRLEAPAPRGLAEAVALADLSARELPRFASDAARDPRAPQNLYPIGGLEARLKHRLGDATVVRRAIEAQLHREVTA